MENNRPPRQEGVTLREYMESRFDGLTEMVKTVIADVKGLVESRFAASDTALNKAYSSMEKRLEGMTTQIRLLEISKATLEGKASAGAVYITWGIALLSLIIAAISLFVRFA